MDILVSVVLPLSLAFIMFSLGVGLTLGDFLRVVERPVAFLVGALNQVVLLPVIAFAVVLLFGPQAEMAVGVMILAVCPGGVTTNIVTKLARGDVALSVTLTAVISLVSVITVPLVLAFAMERFMGTDAPSIDILGTALTMFLLTVVPIVLGLIARRLFATAMMRAEPLLNGLATLLFVIVVIAALAANWELFLENVVVLGPLLVTLVVLLTAVGFFLPRALGRSQDEAKTISIETSIQNGTLGIVVGALLVGESTGISPFSVPSAVYGVLMYLTLIPAVFIYRRMA